MDTEKFEKIRAIYDAKTRNGMEVMFWTIIEEIAKEVPDITLEELRRLTLAECCRLYERLPGVDAVTNIKHILKYLKQLINEFKNIIKLNVSEEWKQKRLSEAEEKLSTLLGYLSVAIRDYVGDSLQAQFAADETLTKLASSYMEALKIEDI